MKYDVTYSCGHEGTVELFGKNSERERKIWYFENHGLCPECYKKACDEAKAEFAAYTEQVEALYDLPELEGTEKQVAWAREIRAKRIRHMKEHEGYFFDNFLAIAQGRIEETKFYEYQIKHGMTSEEAKTKVLEAAQDGYWKNSIRLFMETSAKWFIENMR